MRFVIQVVKEASVKVDRETIGQIGKGYVVLIGISDSDTEAVADKMIRKMTGLRIFADENGKTNLSLADVNCKKGNRPSFIEAGAPDKAEALYEYIIRECRKTVPDVQTGRFGAEMEVGLVNDGPFTILLDSETL